MPQHHYTYPRPEANSPDESIAYAAADVIDQFCHARESTGGLINLSNDLSEFTAISVYGGMELPLYLALGQFAPATFSVFEITEPFTPFDYEADDWAYISPHFLRTPDYGIQAFRVIAVVGFPVPSGYDHDPVLAVASDIVSDNIRGARSRQGTATQSGDLLAGARDILIGYRAP